MTEPTVPDATSVPEEGSTDPDGIGVGVVDDGTGTDDVDDAGEPERGV